MQCQARVVTLVMMPLMSLTCSWRRMEMAISVAGYYVMQSTECAWKECQIVILIGEKKRIAAVQKITWQRMATTSEPSRPLVIQHETPTIRRRPVSIPPGRYATMSPWQTFTWDSSCAVSPPACWRSHSWSHQKLLPTQTTWCCCFVGCFDRDRRDRYCCNSSFN
mgnify:CR=1 FL=1